MARSERAEMVERAILRRVRDGGLVVGDVICTELELVSSLGVSRNIVRESVARLRGLGILTNRRNCGLILTRTVPHDVFGKLLANYATDSGSLRELLDLRLALEIGTIALAVARASAQDIQEILSSARKYARDVRKCPNARQLAQMDLDFHVALLSATHSSLLQGMHKVLEDYFSRTMGVLHDEEQIPRVAAEHVAIAEAVAARNARKARRILERHLQALEIVLPD